jgi:hypothetical protein
MVSVGKYYLTPQKSKVYFRVLGVGYEYPLVRILLAYLCPCHIFGILDIAQSRFDCFLGCSHYYHFIGYSNIRERFETGKKNHPPKAGGFPTTQQSMNQP